MLDIRLSQANSIIEAALKNARELNLPRLGVAVVDSGGHLVALQREDGASFMHGRVCEAKAYGAIGLGVDSRDIAARYERARREEGFINALNVMTGGRIITLPGGVLILDAEGEVCGAVGVAGAASDDDKTCALAGITAAGLQARIQL